MAERRRFRVVDIADQSGLSRATVDRVLHGRPGVRPETVAQVERAVAELERQADRVQLSRKPLLLDFVIQAPERFATASLDALDTELRALHPVVARSRTHAQEHSDAASAARTLDRIRDRGSDGVILKAPDHPAVVAAIDRLASASIPTVTYVTDVPTSRRVAYVGMDNETAGATAAFLVAHWRGSVGDVLVTSSHSSFRGEDERIRAFRATLTGLAPGRRIVLLADTSGVDEDMVDGVRAALEAHPAIDAVYSVGGGNAAISAAFRQRDADPAIFVAHDLDRDNVSLLREGRLSVVLHHDLSADLRRGVHLLLQARGQLPGVPTTLPSPVQVITRYNEPSALRRS
jgi:LacI family transcriptional regulator